jgi:hypothetical protein
MLHWVYKTQKEANVKIKTIRLDNSGENTAFKKLIDRTNNLKIKIEFTAPGTPDEPNGKIKRAFATLYGKTRSLLSSAKLTVPLRKGLWAQFAELTESIILAKANDKSVAKKFNGKNLHV